MRSRIFPAVGLSVAALAAATTFAPMASASHDAISPVHHSATKAAPLQVTKGSCYSQSGADAGNAGVSQNFTDAGGTFDAYDNQAADDFKLKKTCKVSKVTIVGQYFNGAGPAESFNVVFYDAKGKNVGKPVKNGNLKNLKYKFDGNIPGEFAISLKKPLSLTKGSYWVSVQANMAFGSGGEFGWELTNDITGTAAMWQNPGDGFASGCTKYMDYGTCLALGGPVDTIFSISQ